MKEELIGYGGAVVILGGSGLMALAADRCCRVELFLMLLEIIVILAVGFVLWSLRRFFK